tara:strand:+ start:121 stop:852 length:732 start_codon:yes stop_codon:yes gene_type:complete
MSNPELSNILRSPKQKVASFIHFAKAKFRQEKFKEVKKLEPYILKNSVIFDIGAQFGQYSKQFSKIHQGTCIIYAFEPFQYSRNILKKVIQGKKNIKIFSNAFSDKIYESTINIPIKDSGKLGPGLAHIGKEEKRDFVQQKIDVQTIDSFILNENIVNLSFIKIDIEGAEILVFEGAKQTIKNFRPAIKCEIDENLIKRFNKKPEDIFKFFKNFNYKSFILNKDFQEVSEYSIPSDYLFLPQK